MTWSIKFDSVTNIVEIVLSGLVTAEELTEAATERIRLQKEHGTSLTLADASQIAKLEAGILDVHKLPAEIYKSVHADRTTNIALVSPRLQDAIKIAKHYETASVNRGWNVRMFQDRTQAIAWLLEKKPSTGAD